MNVYFKDTSYIWWLFNDCTNSRGYFAKIPFNKSLSIHRTGRALNKFDLKFAVAHGLAAHTDKGNLFVEEMSTGKKAMMTFGQELPDFDPDAVHETIDSVNITPTRIWAKVRIGKDWQIFEKNISLQLQQ